MKFIDGKLYMEFTDMTEADISDNYLRKAKSAGTKCWNFINDPEDKRKVLIGYDELSEKYKTKLTDRWGDPYVVAVQQPILDLIKPDVKAELYYKQYRFDDSKYLPQDRVRQYTRAASWLNMLHMVQEDRSIIKEVLGLKRIPDFYLSAGQLIKKEKENGKRKEYNGYMCLTGDFPSSYQRIMNKVATYIDGGYDSLIDPMYGNKLASKIGKTSEGYDPEVEEHQTVAIRAIASKHNNLDAAQVCKLANALFQKNGWYQVTRRRVHQIMEEMKPTTTSGRRGVRVYEDEVGMQIKRAAPKYPLYFWSLDGWTAELLYQEEGDYYNRLVIVVVMDACTKYPIGYAIGNRENTDLIRQANRNALLHLQELFGDRYHPLQVQSDRYGLKNLTPFYAAMAHLHTPARVGNAKSKPIEPYFKYLNKEYCQLQPNWSGFNIDSKKSNQVNREYLNKVKKMLPMRDGVEKQLHGIMAAERKRKIDEYRRLWGEMPEEDKNVMTDMDWISVFGEAIGDTNRIIGCGIEKQIDGCQYTWDSFDPDFRKNMHLDWQIVADRNDMSKVLAVSPDGRIKHLLEAITILPIDVHSTTDEHREWKKRVETFNKERKAEVIKRYAEDAEIMEEIINNTPLAIDDYTEAALKMMFTDPNGQQKEAIQDAKRLKDKPKKLPQPKVDDSNWNEERQSYINGKIDINKYL